MLRSPLPPGTPGVLRRIGGVPLLARIATPWRLTSDQEGRATREGATLMPECTGHRCLETGMACQAHRCLQPVEEPRVSRSEQHARECAERRLNRTDGHRGLPAGADTGPGVSAIADKGAGGERSCTVYYYINYVCPRECGRSGRLGAKLVGPIELPTRARGSRMSSGVT